MRLVDFDRISDTLNSYWNHEYTGRCVAYLTAPKKKLSFEKPADYDALVRTWTDGEEVLKRNRLIFENTYFLGESFPLINLNLGASGHAGYFSNVRYQFADNTVWFFPIDEDEELSFSKDSYFYKSTMNLARYLCTEGKGEFIVSMPDISGNVDALAHLRGSENVMMNMISDPSSVKKELGLIQSAWEAMIPEVFNIVKENNYGGSSIGWMGTYAKGLHSQLQSDMSVMLSKELFGEFVRDELKRQADILEFPTYHFDGIEQARHLDVLLSIEKIKMIQYTCVAGQPSPLEKLDILRKIQESGKLLLIISKPEWVKPLLENLSAKGLFLKINAADPEEAEDIFKIISDYSKIR
ncbi:hypothetical protein FACS189447_00290 [Spirochaetia bacterium]|nr:hypothetical protein FACS189447_00290 [Spirochaetia bacterium]